MSKVKKLKTKNEVMPGYLYSDFLNKFLKVKELDKKNNEVKPGMNLMFKRKYDKILGFEISEMDFQVWKLLEDNKVLLMRFDTDKTFTWFELYMHEIYDLFCEVEI